MPVLPPSRRGIVQVSSHATTPADSTLSGLGALLPDLETLYKDIHSHPELSMHETRTAGLAAERLRAAGYEVTTGIGKTGVVGLLRNGDGPTVMLRAVTIIFGVLSFRTESRSANAFVDFRRFRNATYTGATISNLLLNAVAGILLVSMTLVQVGGGMSAQAAGLVTLGHAVAIVAFIRVGEKLLQRFGSRKPMIWGSLIVGLSIVLLMPTHAMLGTYKVLAIVAFTLFGVRLGFYATPSPDAAVATLPDDQAGSSSGL